MKDMIFSTPWPYVYLVFVVVFLLMALWPRDTGPPVGAPRVRLPKTDQGAGDGPVAARCHLDRASLPSSAWQRRRDERLFRDLQVTLSASYADQLEQAIRTIRASSACRLCCRSGPPQGSWPGGAGSC
jgi:hypothetical protein